MKPLTLFLRIMLLLVVALVPALLMAQDTLAVPGDSITPPTFDSPLAVFEYFDALYAALILIAGYLSHLIPVIKKIPKKVYRVFTFALITGTAAVLFGGANIIGLAVTYASTTSVYEILLKWIQGLFKKKDAPGA